jgi:steroid delta-isomerase-like uncharacterized protein
LADSRITAIALVRRYYEAFNRGDWAGMAECLSDDVVHDVNQGGRRTGKDIFLKFSAHMDTCYSEQLKDIVIMASDDGARAAAEFLVDGIYKATDEGLPPARGQKYKLPAGAFLDIADGKITRVTTYYNLQQWLKMVA